MSGVIPYETFESRPPRRKARYIRVKRRAAAFALVLSVGFSAAFGFGAGNALGSAAAGAQNLSLIHIYPIFSSMPAIFSLSATFCWQP